MSHLPVVSSAYLEEKRGLAHKYGLNYIQLEFLLMIEANGGATEFDQIKGYSGQPGQTLRSMVARGWLSGPGPKEKPRAKPWALSEEGKRLLDKIRRGVRPPGSLTPDQYDILKKKGAGETGFSGFHHATFNSLVRHGLLTPGLALTEMGQEVYGDLLLYEKGLAAKGL